MLLNLKDITEKKVNFNCSPTIFTIDRFSEYQISSIDIINLSPLD